MTEWGWSISKLLSISLCLFVNLFPYMLLITLTFRQNFRFSGRKIGLCLTLLALLDILIRLPASMGIIDERILMLLVTALYAGCFFLCVRTTPGKALFVLFMVLNYACLASALAIYLLSLIGRESYPLLAFPNVLALVAVQAVTFPLIYLYLLKRIRPLVASEESPKAWKVIWLVPAAFYVIYYFYYYADFAGSTLYQSYRQMTNVLFILLLQAGFFLVYEIIRLLLRESVEKMRLMEQNRALSMMAAQYNGLLERIDSTRRARHDLRHHLIILDGFLQQRDLEGMSRYLSEYQASLPSDEELTLCANPAVNVVACYYREQCRRDGIQCGFSLDLPQALPLPENDFCGILGNLLENAWEACRRMEDGEPFLWVRAWTGGPQILVLVVENSYQGELHPLRGGFLSSKRKEMGVGLDSVRTAAERHNGLLTVEHEKGLFRANVFLNPSQSEERNSKLS